MAALEGHSGQKCNLIATCIPLDHTFLPLDRTFIPLDRTFLPFDRTSIPLDHTFIPLDRSSIPLDHTFLPFNRTSIPLDRTFLPFDCISITLSLAILHWFFSNVAFQIYPHPHGNSIPSDCNYCSAVVTIWSAMKRERLNLDLVFVWRHTTYDYMTYN